MPGKTVCRSLEVLEQQKSRSEKTEAAYEYQNTSINQQISLNAAFKCSAIISAGRPSI